MVLFQGRQRRSLTGKTVTVAATLTACHRYCHHVLFRKFQTRLRSCGFYLPWRPWTFQSSSSNTEHSGRFCLILFLKKTKQKRRMVQTSGGWKNSNRLSIFVMLLLLFYFLFLQNLVGLLPPSDPRFHSSCEKLKQTRPKANPIYRHY